LVFVELPKFHKELEELTSLVDKWLYFLKYANRLETVPSKMKIVPAIDHAFSVAEQSRLSREELEILEKRQIFLHDSRNAILKAKQQGLQQGLQQGAYQEEIAIARSLLDILDVETIVTKTGLSIEEINQL
jgi:predicted transposase/invertase (TIGR01784 family)